MCYHYRMLRPALRPTHSLPEGYALRAAFSARERRTLLLLNLAGLALLILFGWRFAALALRLRPLDAAAALSFDFSGAQLLSAVIVVLLLTGLMLVLHEAIHGLGFWLATGARPTFGIGRGYAYAAAPEWYLPRSRYLWIGLAPLLVISSLAVLVIAFGPPVLIGPALLLAVMNASGAVGDLWVVYLLLRQPPGALVCDRGDEVRFYLPQPPPPVDSP